MAADGGLVGGAALQAYLEKIAAEVSAGEGVKVGFLEGSTYPDGTPVPMVAAVQEFGGTINIPEHTRDLHFKYNEKTGDVSHRFVRKAKANFAQTVTVPAHQITVPARPFFRNMLAEKAPTWGDDLGKALVAAGYDAEAALGVMGSRITDQLKDSIRKTSEPANADSTVKRKGFNNPLIDTGHMLNSVDFEVGSE